MSRHLSRALPWLLLAAAVPAIPVIALFTAPHQDPASVRARLGGRALALSAAGPRDPARYLELEDRRVRLRPAGPPWHP